MRRILPAGLLVFLVAAPAIAQPSAISPGDIRRPDGAQSGQEPATAAFDTPEVEFVALAFEPPPNGVVVAEGAALHTRFEPIDAQTVKDEGNTDPRIRIDSPRDGAVVASGETMQVRVSSPNRTRFDGITIVMEDSVDIADQEAASLPARFAIKIPKDTASGSYSVSAVAGLAGRAGRDGELVVAVIEVDIERRDMPRAITWRQPKASFEKKSEREIGLIGDFGIGDLVDVDESSYLTFESSDTAVATVNSSGTITAVGAGHAEVVAWYGPRDRGIKATIAVEVR